jgi:hypothetical protein
MIQKFVEVHHSEFLSSRMPPRNAIADGAATRSPLPSNLWFSLLWWAIALLRIPQTDHPLQDEAPTASTPITKHFKTSRASRIDGWLIQSIYRVFEW